MTRERVEVGHAGDSLSRATASSSITTLRFIRLVAEVAFGLLLVLGLITPSWRYGPFASLPLWRYQELAGGPMTVGVANLLPLLVVAGLTTGWLARRGRNRWRWGPAAVVLPLLGLTIAGLLNVDYHNFRLAFIYGGMFALSWLVYLYVVNERPRLLPALAAILAIQGVVAIGQFVNQRDLGLGFLGELPLHPLLEGNSVLWARGRPWLRAYGLTAHPNLLGAMLAALLLLVLPALGRFRGARRAGLAAAALLGAAGLFLSFSRASWLAFAAGLGVWWLMARFSRPRESGRQRVRRRWALAAVPLLLLIIAYRDLAFSRFFALDSPIEATSINQRLHDAALALEIIGDRPLTGVGLGNYVDAAERLDADAARVHNVGLLVTAELGLPGLLLWAALMVAPFWLLVRKRGNADARFAFRHAAAQLAPWVAMLVVNTFDTMLWLNSNWQTSILFALLVANLVQPIAQIETADYTAFNALESPSM